eukprot:m.181967 g.181967  ORF g.181967 m.181967 type:complete len:917 (-) comp53478_c0_seq1:90-2840(-)
MVRHTGGPSTSYYEDAGTHALLEPVRAWLHTNAKKYITEPVTTKQLAQLICSLIQFQEENLGAASSDPPLIRFPARLFRDYKAGGALAHILATCYKYKAEQGLRRFEFSSPAKLDRNIELFMQIEKKLTDIKKFSRPIVYFHETISAADAGPLRDLAKRFQIQVVPVTDEATHIIYPAIPPDPNEEESDWFRVVEKSGSLSLHHWWYYPDSHESWQAADADQAHPEPPVVKKVWEVQARWLTDMAKFNEYMNEEDYELTEDDKARTTPRPNGPRSTREQRTRRESEADETTRTRPTKPVEADTRETEAVRRDSQSAAKRAGDDAVKATRGVSKEQEVKGAVPKRKLSVESEVRRRKRSGSVSSEEDVAERGLTGEAPALLPPEPFPRLLEILPQGAPATAALKPPPRSIAAIIDISECDGPVPPTRSSKILPRDLELTPSLTVQVAEPSNLHVVMPFFASWYNAATVQEVEIRGLPEFFNGTYRHKGPAVYMGYRNFMIDTYRANPTEYLTISACCRQLVGEATTILRVHGFLEYWGLINYQVSLESRSGPLTLPSMSYLHLLADTPNGLSGYTPVTALDKLSDSDRIASVAPIAAAAKPPVGLRTDGFEPRYQLLPEEVEWTDQEILSLLEGVDLHKDAWNRVAHYVNLQVHRGDPVRTHDDCIAAFARLPIEESIVTADIAAPSEAGTLPFANSHNPVMQMVSMLATALDPRVAAAAARAALIELSIMPQNLLDEARGMETESTSVSAGRPMKESPAHTPAEQELAADMSTRSTETEPVVKLEDQPKTEPSAAMDTSTTTEPAPAKTAAELAAASQSAKILAFGSQKITQERLATAAHACLGAAVAKSRFLVQEEEQKIKALTAQLVEYQMQKIELKLRTVEEIEASIANERRTLDEQRKHIVLLRQQLSDFPK